MAECKHVFIGKTDGVHCNKCGLKMNTVEYALYQQLKSLSKKSWIFYGLKLKALVNTRVLRLMSKAHEKDIVAILRYVS